MSRAGYPEPSAEAGSGPVPSTVVFAYKTDEVALWGTVATPVAVSAAAAGDVTTAIDARLYNGLALKIDWLTAVAPGILKLRMESSSNGTTNWREVPMQGSFAVATAGPVRTSAAAAPDEPGALTLVNTQETILYHEQWSWPAAVIASTNYNTEPAFNVSPYRFVRFRIFGTTASNLLYLGYVLSTGT